MPAERQRRRFTVCGGGTVNRKDRRVPGGKLLYENLDIIRWLEDNREYMPGETPPVMIHVFQEGNGMSKSASKPVTQPELKNISQPESQPELEAISQPESQPASQPGSKPASKPVIRVTYGICFWLFMIANLAGVLIEGFFYLFAFGEWETHVVTMWGPFCLLYGFGTVGFYLMAAALQGKGVVLEFIGYGLVGDGLELVGGLLLEFGLGMRAWDYSDYYLNYRGHICLRMTIVWAIIGFAFSRFCPLISRGLSQFDHGRYRVLLIIILSVFMLVNLIFTSICIVRWSRRHHGIKAESSFEKYLDERYDDAYMSKRFVEWSFLDEKK